ncbi:MAG: phospholipase D-like domain-containing protein [Prevotellaceae bacterium]|nr:phospholipase D-like domain-containing protein [Prevotellaceae bacterium]
MLYRYLEDNGIPVTPGNRLQLLTSGHDKFIDLFEAVRRARHHIHLEYFNFRNDSIAGALFDLLAEKVSEGVTVRAMFDAFGNSSNNRPLKQAHVDSLRARGIEIVEFDPLRFPWLNHVLHRDHRKIVVIDGVVGYTGGMNIADYYINGLPEIGEWRDMHLRIEGDAVRYLQGIFLTMWNRETGQHIGGPEYFPEQAGADNVTSLEANTEAAASPLEAPLSAPCLNSLEADTTLFTRFLTLPGADTLASPSAPVAIVDRVPRETPRAIGRVYVASIASARQRLQIVNPYFVPTHGVRKALKKALKRGIDVEIMLPSVSDIPFTPDAGFYVAHRLMKRGAKVYLYDKGFYHAKIMMVDTTYCTVGTANLNSRSLRYDYETNAFLLDPVTTRHLSDLFERDKQSGTLMTPAYWKQRSRWRKFVGWVANLMSPFL